MKTNLYVVKVPGKGYLKGVNEKARTVEAGVLFTPNKLEAKHVSEQKATELVWVLNIQPCFKGAKLEVLGSARVR